MKSDTPRVAKLRELVEKAGGLAPFAKSYSQKDADKPIDETYVSQILNGHRAFGEKAAANMERRAGLPQGYFEETIKLSKEDIEWIAMRRSLNSDQQRAVFNLGNSLAEHPKQNHNTQ